jgi:hypothetical protein
VGTGCTLIYSGHRMKTSRRMSHEAARDRIDDAAQAAEGKPRPAPQLRAWLPNLLLTLPFVLLLWVNLAHHQLWLDELNAWGLSAASPTLHSLFANVRYEGHPWLWYFLLWIPAQFTHSPVALKWVAALLGAATYLVIGMLSPFSRREKVLLFLSYFVAFEYTVLSRTYCPMFLLACIYAWRRTARPQAILVNLLLLGALANTDLTGIMLSAALLLEYVIHLRTQHTPIRPGLAAGAAALYLGMVAVSVATLWPARDISWATTGHLFAKATSAARFAHALTDVTVGPWWPILRSWPHEFWNTDVDFNHAEVLFIPLVLAGYFWTFRRRPSLLLLMSAVVLLALSFAHLVYIGYPRHWGLTVAGFLVALWILRGEDRQPRQLSRVAYIFLAVAALKGVASLAASWTHPFSETGNVAHWVRQEHLDALPLVGASDFNVAGVAEQLEKPVYFLNCDCVDTYMKFAHRRDGMEMSDIPDRIVQASRTLHVPRFLLVLDTPLDTDAVRSIAVRGVAVEHLKDFTGSEDHYGFYAYLASPQRNQH